MSLSMDISSKEDLVERLRIGGMEELSCQFEMAREQLHRLISVRLGPLKRRLDASDIVQEAYLEASRQLPDYLASPQVLPIVWFRQIGRQVLSRQFRRHVGTAKRSTRRERSVDARAGSQIGMMADQLSESIDSPSRITARDEVRVEMRRLLATMDSEDQEVLWLKQLDGLSFAKIAEELGTSESTVKRRFHRAVMVLQKLTADIRE